MELSRPGSDPLEFKVCDVTPQTVANAFHVSLFTKVCSDINYMWVTYVENASSAIGSDPTTHLYSCNSIAYAKKRYVNLFQCMDERRSAG